MSGWNVRIGLEIEMEVCTKSDEVYDKYLIKLEIVV